MISDLTLEKMSLDEKRLLLQLALEREEAEKARRIDFYKPHSGAWRGKPHDGQLAFHKGKSRTRILTGGNQTGKSNAGAVEALWYALGIHPYKKVQVPNKGRVIASLGFSEGASQIIVPKLYEYLPQGALKGEPKKNQAGVPAEWEFVNGSTFNILSGEQLPKVFEGWTGHWGWVDEPSQKYIYDATKRGLLRNHGDLWMTMTPLTEPWVYNDLYIPWISGERDDVEFFNIDIWDNCVENGGYLSRQAIEEFEKDLSPEDREARLHGKFRFLSGRIYPQFDNKVHVVEDFEIPRNWDVWEGIDPHLQKEHAYCQWAIVKDDCVINGVEFCEDDIVCCGEIYSKVTIEQLADLIHKMRKGKHIVCSLIDTSSETPDSVSRTTPRRVLERKGIRTRLAHKQDMVNHGIHLMRDLLTPRECNDKKLRPRYYIMRQCSRHIKEFMNYVQDDRDSNYLIKDKPRKIWDDFMDLDRYFVVENPVGRMTDTVYSNQFRYGNFKRSRV